MAEYQTLAAVDLGSNSFHCQIARVLGEQLYPLDSLREPVRLAAGLTADRHLNEEVQERALACLHRFGERLRGFERGAVRAVGTNTLRVAKNASSFIRRAVEALGFPIEVVAGREEARLIYLGVAHSIPASPDKRLVVDIGGGSTEFIIGTHYRARLLQSLYMGCVSYSLRYFGDGRLTRSAFKQAELAARNEVQPIYADFGPTHWSEAVGSSGTLRTIAQVMQLNGMDDGDISPSGLDRLRASLIKAGDLADLALTGLRPDRVPVLPGGVAIIRAIMAELGIQRMTVAPGAMREGLLYDLLGRVHRHDMRDVTVAQFMQRYHVDAKQARQVAALAHTLCADFRWDSAQDAEYATRQLAWAAKLHEIGIPVAYSGYHRHGAYILANADMPGFSRDEQQTLSALVLAHRRSLRKVWPAVREKIDPRLILALRLAVLFYRHRTAIDLREPRIRTEPNGFRLVLDRDWLHRNPLTAAVLDEEVKEWLKIGYDVRVPGLAEAIDHTNPAAGD
ncbi:MAG: exopolyphosphatase [Rhodospirillaceae bacterium]